MSAKADRAKKHPEYNGLAGEAYVTVRERILRGELAIGQVISRRKVAAELGMSFLPVSEALLRLEHEGLLESRPRAGTRVRVPTRPDVQGHYVVREALESHAAMLFATQATRDERSELMKLAARVDALSVNKTDGNRFVYLSLHEKLHRRIAECARCAALSNAISRTSALASTWLCATRTPSPGNPPSHHENLIRVLVAGDPVAASEAMRQHIRASMEHALRRLEPYFQLQKVHPQTYSRTPKKRLQLSA
jgi:DNA-binding GntR family transcriptional regulator